MPVVIPAVFFSTLLFAFAGTGKYGLRQSLVYASTIYTLCLVLATELFSIWNILTFEVLLAFWTGLTIVSGLYLYFYRDRKVVLQVLNDSWTKFRASKALWAVALVWSIILTIAMVYPPNTWDSMVYHMPRVMSWIQQGSIGFFPAADLKQLHQPPLAEWSRLHFQILSGGDRFATTVQWLALVGCGVAASLVARELKQPFRVQVLALVIAATLPMGLLQGASTQSDLVVSFWLLTFALFALLYLRKPTTAHMAFCGLAIGFALLTKGTAYVFSPPLAAMLLLYGIIHSKGYAPRVKLVSAAAVVVGVALLLNSGHWTRNWGLFGHPQPPSDPGDFYTEANVSVVWLNIVHHAALHLGVPSDRINAITLDVIRGILGDLLDIPETTYRNQILSVTFSKNELFAGNVLHFWMLMISLLGIVLFGRYFQFSTPTVYWALAIVLGIILYSSVLRWDPGASRRHTPLFILGAPITAVFVSRLGSRISGHFTKIFLIVSVPWIFFNETRPVYMGHDQSIFSMNRREEYFRNVGGTLRPYIRVVEYLKKHKPQEVGIRLNQYEYPFRVLLEESLENPPRLEHIVVENVSKSLRMGEYTPPYVVSVNKPLDTIGALAYRVVWMAPEVVVLAREELASELVGKMFEGDALVIESKYDVYVRDNALLYVKRTCSKDDIEATFFVHVAPVDVNDLAYYRRQYRSDNLDFRFEEHGWRSDSMCLAARRLPTYAISHIKTGQYGSGEDHIWEGSFSLDR